MRFARHVVKCFHNGFIVDRIDLLTEGGNLFLIARIFKEDCVCRIQRHVACLWPLLKNVLRKEKGCGCKKRKKVTHRNFSPHNLLTILVVAQRCENGGDCLSEGAGIERLCKIVDDNDTAPG